MSIAAPLPLDEAERLARLHALDVLDSEAEPVFDAIVAMASDLCGTPVALVSLVDRDRQWFKAHVGLPGVRQTPREVAFCAHAILQPEVLEVPDAQQDPRFRDSPLVRGAPHIRFYAGAPIRMPDGLAMGAVCVTDRVPRQLDEHQRRALEGLARMTAAALQMRQHGRAAVIRAEAEAAGHRALAERMAAVLDGTRAGTWEWNVQTGECRFNERWAEIVGLSLDELGTADIETWTRLIHPEDRALSTELQRRHFAGELDHYECQTRMRHRHGHWVWVLDRGRVASRTADGQPQWMFGTHTDISHIKGTEEALREAASFLDRTGRIAGVGGWQLDLSAGRVTWSPQTCRIHDLPPGHAPTLDETIQFYPHDVRPRVVRALEQALSSGASYDLELPMTTASGRRIWVRSAGTVEYQEGRPVRLAGAYQDITARKSLEQQIAEGRELLRVTLASIGDAVVTTNPAGEVTWMNPVAERMTGWTSDEARGLPLPQVFNVVAEDTRQPAANPVAHCLEQGHIVGLAAHTVLISRDGREYGIEDSASPIRDASGRVLGAVLVFHDVSEQRRLSQEMSHRATHDALTGLVNRSEFELRLQRTLERTQEDDGQHSVLFIDLDQFKVVNDMCGHSAGDQLLRQVSALLKGCMRSRDTLGRLGGDEFAAILEHCPPDQALRAAQAVCDQMDHFRFAHDGRRFRIGASIGLVPLDRRWCSVAALLQAADSACYAAKDAGRNRVHVWLDSDTALMARQGQTRQVSRLEQALDDDRFVLFAQRVVRTDGTAEDPHLEVLLRLREPDGTIVVPGAFLPAAERFHMVSRIDRWVLRRVCEWMTRAAVRGDRLGLVAVNLSGQSIGDRAFHAFVRETLAQARFDVRLLCFEITETTAITHLADATAFIQEMRAAGVRVALDDFGAGASSFGYLKALPVDFLKIDGKFIRDMLDNPLDDAAVRCFSDVANILGVRTVAEFVEREDTRIELQRIGVHYCQGYLVHRPEPLDALPLRRAEVVRPRVTA